MLFLVELIGGIVLRANQDWFNGAGTVGWILLALAAIQVLFTLIVGGGIFGLALSETRSSRRRRL